MYISQLIKEVDDIPHLEICIDNAKLDNEILDDFLFKRITWEDMLSMYLYRGNTAIVVNFREPVGVITLESVKSADTAFNAFIPKM